MDLRLLLISHAATAAQRAGRIPADPAGADSLDARGIADTAAARARLALPGDAIAFVSPAACARETASALGLAATVEPKLADMNYGRWHGQKLIDIAATAPDQLAAWTRDPDAAPHGGESFSQLVIRLGAWLDTQHVADPAALDESTGAGSNPGSAPRTSTHMRNLVAVTHAPLLRAAIVHALGATPAIFPRIEIAPLSVVELRRSPRGWTWRPAAN